MLLSLWPQFSAAEGDATALFQKGKSLLNSRDYAQAVEVFTNALSALDPAGHNAHVVTLARAKAYFGNGDIKSALKDINDVVTAQGVEGQLLASALQLRGVVNLRREQEKRALEDLTAAIKTRHEDEPLRALCFATRGMILIRLGNADTAVSDLNKAVELDPKSGYAYAVRGLAHLRQDKIEQAKRDSEQAMRLTPDEQTKKIAEKVIKELSVSASGPASISVPLADDGHLYVLVRFSKQGTLHRFLLDTGATESVVHSDLLEEISRETEVKHMGKRKGRTADGSVHLVTCYRAKTAFLFNLPLGEIEFHVFDKKGKKMTNLLGMNSLRNIAVSIDTAERKAQITRK